MPVLTPLIEQDPVPLPEGNPMLNRQLGPGFQLEDVPDLRHITGAFLTEPRVIERVGHPIPLPVRQLVELLVTEGLSNAHRPNIGRVATSLLVWVAPNRIEVAFGDNSDQIDGNDGREQTAILPSDINGNAPEVDLDAVMKNLTEHGLGRTVMERQVDEVCWSLVGLGDAARSEEPRTHKIVRNVVTV